MARTLPCNLYGPKETWTLLVYCITIAPQPNETDRNWFLLSKSLENLTNLMKVIKEGRARDY